MISTRRPTLPARLLAVDPDGQTRQLMRSALVTLFSPGDLVIANDAATLPASLHGIHRPTEAPIEVRLAAWLAPGDPTRFTAVVFGQGDHRTPTEDRPSPPPLQPGDQLTLGPLMAHVERLLGHPRLINLRFSGDRYTVLAGLARHGRPIQYAHAPELVALRDVWTHVAAAPVAFEPPSAGFALNWTTLAGWRRRGIGFATLTHAAGISATGDSDLDARLPFDESYRIPSRTTAAIGIAKLRGGRVIAIGASVVRALESAADESGLVRPGPGVASGRIGAGSRLNVADAIITGVHNPGEGHYELLRAFADDALLDRITAELSAHRYCDHEFGDFVLVERAPVPWDPLRKEFASRGSVRGR